MARINKEQEGLTKRFSIRIPTEMHRWLTARSKSSEEYISMNTIIVEAIKEYIEK